jgi:transcriptional regulator with XRE-family HTH domain
MDATEYKKTRIQLGLSQAGLAALLGVSLRTIANRESGVHPISHEAAVAIRSLAAAPK